eukprot:TRINITY_DN9150_c0_g1_i1.p1 TRINITY_DN9150_c0_g1~~TRINITY_DN9150_c0_g1_i1.p1  ORF type:complete len:310 (+),score=119.00 TRINITY_DN9150_c0_g1_i1:42-932(+)
MSGPIEPVASSSSVLSDHDDDEEALVRALADSRVTATRALLVLGAATRRTGVSAGAAPSMPVCEQSAWMREAVEQDSVEILRLMLESGERAADVDDALMIAAARGKSEMVHMLLDYGADVSAARANGRTALIDACSESQAATARVLLARGANVNQADQFQRRPIQFAINAGDAATVQLLLAQPSIDTQSLGSAQDDCIQVATRKKRPDLVAMVARHRCDVERARLVEIGLAFVGKDLPLLLLHEIYVKSVVFHEQTLRMFDCWEILKSIKHKHHHPPQKNLVQLWKCHVNKERSSE